MISAKTCSLLFTLGIFMIACQPSAKNGQMTAERLASLICACSVPIVTYNDELRALAAADNLGALSQKMTQGDQIMGTAIRCITDQIEQEPNNLLNEKLHLLINERCHLDRRMATDLIQKVADFEIPTF